jgi:hypothetical protein
MQENKEQKLADIKVKVAVRTRPFLQKEINEKAKNCINIFKEKKLVFFTQKKKDFFF